MFGSDMIYRRSVLFSTILYLQYSTLGGGDFGEYFSLEGEMAG